MGYLSLDGAADFNVVIRTIIIQGEGARGSSVFRLGLELNSPICWSELTIGAGGAITWLSDARAEWEEVGVKVGSVLKGFETSVDM